VLGQHQSVKDAVVLARDDPSGTKRLVAYVIPAEGKAPTAAEMREFLAAKLPDYMVPSAFVVMDSFPLTSSAKLDRARLPEPDLLRDAPERTFVAPRNEIEIQLKAVWERILGVQPVSVTDNFFEIGGHSLLAVRLFSEVNALFGTTVELAELFQSPTIEKLARIIRAGQRHDSGSSLVAIRPGGSKPPLFFVHAYGGGVFFYRELAQSLDPDRPFYGLQSIALGGTKRPHRSVKEMAAHYIRDIRAVKPEGPYYIGGRCLGAYVAFEMANQLYALGEQVGMLAILDSYWMPEPETPAQERIATHMNNLFRGSLRERLAYFWKHMGNRTMKTRLWLAKFVSDICFLMKRPIPSFMKDFYVTVLIPEINTEAERKYRPSIYPGVITFFQATAEVERDPATFWGKMTSGGLEVIMVPASHVDILVAPNVGVLAEKLDAAIAKAQQGE
jgi:thioesterase domain-containing protein/acyl carrier protein